MEEELGNFSSCHVLLMMLEIMQIKLMGTANSEQAEKEGCSTLKCPLWIGTLTRTTRGAVDVGSGLVPPHHGQQVVTGRGLSDIPSLTLETSCSSKASCRLCALPQHPSSEPVN